MSYEVGEKANLKVSPLRGVRRFGIKGKLPPRYVGPFSILAERGELSCQLELPSNFPNVHDVFHVSQLRRCFKDLVRGVDHESLNLQPDLSYREHHVRILDEAERKTRRQTIKFLNVEGVASDTRNADTPFSSAVGAGNLTQKSSQEPANT